MTPSDLPEDLLTLPEAAARLGMSPRTARRLTETESFPGGAARKVGGKWLVSARLLDKFLHGGQAGASRLPTREPTPAATLATPADRSSAGLLTYAEAADYLGTTASHIMRLRRQRALPSVKVGKTMKFRKEWLEAYIDAHTVEAKP